MPPCCKGNLHKVAAPYFFVLCTIVQLYKEDWGILHMLGCQAVALPSTKQIVQDLHWLKVKEQITFKIAVFLFLCIRDQAPVYLKLLLSCIKTSGRTQRSSTSNQIDRSYCKNSQGKAGAFQYIGPIVWNNLPVTIRTVKKLDMFKNKLNTYFFDISHSI